MESRGGLCLVIGWAGGGDGLLFLVDGEFGRLLGYCARGVTCDGELVRLYWVCWRGDR